MAKAITKTATFSDGHTITTKGATFTYAYWEECLDKAGKLYSFRGFAKSLDRVMEWKNRRTKWSHFEYIKLEVSQ